MARSDTPSARRGLAKTAARARVAGTIVTAAVLLVAPIVLWAQYGDGDIRHAIAVAMIATLLCWCFIHRLDASDTRDATPATPLGYDRSPASARRLDHHRPARAPRLTRDVGCDAAGQLESRGVRRRHP